MPSSPPTSAISLCDSMAAASIGTMSMLRGYPSPGPRAIALGRMLGPRACGEFMRMDFTPSTAQPFNQRLPISTPALRFSSSSGDPYAARFDGALLEMCWTFVPVFTRTPASFSSHFWPEALSGSNPPGRPLTAGKYIVSSVTSPKSPENRSIRVTPGNVSLVNVGKSSIVISPYFAFICSALGRLARAAVAALATASAPVALGFWASAAASASRSGRLAALLRRMARRPRR